MRIETGVTRDQTVSLSIDGEAVQAFAGETIATALLASDRLIFRRDTHDKPRGLFCNMGTCSECFVTVRIGGSAPRRLRACLTSVCDHMQVATGGAPDA